MEVITNCENKNGSQTVKLSSYIFAESLIKRAQRDDSTKNGLLYTLLNTTNDNREVKQSIKLDK